MFPAGYVIARPNGRETLYTRITRAGYGERAFVLHDGAQPLVRCPYHLHAVNIVSLAVRSAETVVLMPHVIRKGTCAKNCRLVHIVPYTGNAHLYQLVK